MLTEAQARDKSRAIWGPTVSAPEQAAAAWLFTLPEDPTVHRIDGHGHVACGHPQCVAFERRALMDQIANSRVRLRRVFHATIGLPDRIEVLEPGGRLLASITATEGAIEIAAIGKAGIRLEPPPGGDPRSLRVRFEV